MQRWPAGSQRAEQALLPRADIVEEVADTGSSAVPGALRFVQRTGPFQHYLRTVDRTDADAVSERIEYRLYVPWWGWLFRRPVAKALRHPRPAGRPTPWWAPPDLLQARQASALALLAMASAVAAFANTLFTQTATFAADDFGVSEGGLGTAGAVVRLGIVIALPFAVVADRVGRRRTIILLAWLTPLLCALGAMAPSFAVLTATQTVARPIGIALSLLAIVAAAEDMPRNSRAFALSLLAMASGLGAGIAVGALRLADLASNGWRYVYLVSLIWLPVAVSLTRHLDETRRFETVHHINPRMNRRRLLLVAAVALTSNLFIAPASYFQNNYLDKVRGYSAGGIALFTLTTGTPASLGLIVGGRLADTVGRHRLIAVCTPLSTACLVGAFFTHGWQMWVLTLLGGFTAAMAYPAFSVYRAELFPTGNRGAANGAVTATALLGGSLGIVVVGFLRDHGTSFGGLMAAFGVGQLLAAWLAVRHYPETAHLELEQLNPEDPAITPES